MDGFPAHPTPPPPPDPLKWVTESVHGTLPEDPQPVILSGRLTIPVTSNPVGFLHVARCAFDALLCDAPSTLVHYGYRDKTGGIVYTPLPTDVEEKVYTSRGCPTGHRGEWWYAPESLEGEVAVGGLVVFLAYRSEVLTVGRVAEFLDKPNSKFCSAINSRGIRWTDVRPVEVEALHLQLTGHPRQGEVAHYLQHRCR